MRQPLFSAGAPGGQPGTRSVDVIVDDLSGPIHQDLRLGDGGLDVLEAHSVDEAVADTLIHHELHVQVGLPLHDPIAVQLPDRLLAADGAEDGEGAELIDVMVHRLHADGAHIGDKKAGVEGAQVRDLLRNPAEPVQKTQKGKHKGNQEVRNDA